jgi:hypothetical protein
MIKLLPAEYGSLSRYMITLGKTYVFFGCVLGISFGVVRGLKYDDFSHIVEDIFYKGFVPAVAFIFLIAIIDLFQKAKCYLKYKVFASNLKQIREFLIDDNYKAVYNNMLEIIDNTDGMEIVRSDLNSGMIEAYVKRSWKSLGERLSIKIESISNIESRVWLSSEPKINIAFIDYCKNFENVEMVIGLFKEKLNTQKTIGKTL